MLRAFRQPVEPLIVYIIDFNSKAHTLRLHRQFATTQIDKYKSATRNTPELTQLQECKMVCYCAGKWLLFRWHVWPGGSDYTYPQHLSTVCLYGQCI